MGSKLNGIDNHTNTQTKHTGDGDADVGWEDNVLLLWSGVEVGALKGHRPSYHRVILHILHNLTLHPGTKRGGQVDNLI